MEKYKFRKEIIPYCCSGLAPRNYISEKDWVVVKEKRLSEIGGKLICECCGYVDGKKIRRHESRSVFVAKKIHLHESFVISGNVFKLVGLFFVCDACHGDIHFSSEGFDVMRNRVYSQYSIKKHNNIILTDEEILPQAYWGFHSECKVDFSFLEGYGVSSVLAEMKFYKYQKYNHLYSYIRAIEECVFKTHYIEFMRYLHIGSRVLIEGKVEYLKFPFDRVINDRVMFPIVRRFLSSNGWYNGSVARGVPFRLCAIKELNAPLVSKGSKMYISMVAGL